MDIVHFVNNSLDNLVKNVVKHGIYHLNQEFNASVLDWLKKKGFFCLRLLRYVWIIERRITQQRWII